MTSEVSILNKVAVALASDSAATLNRGEKIFHSSNKIFTLSKYHPIGIMIYGNSSFMQIPWELIIKEFRSFLGKKELNTVEEYSNEFREYLKSMPILSEQVEIDFVKQLISNIIFNIRKEANEKIELEIDKIDDLTDKAIEEMIYSVIENFRTKYENSEEFDEISNIQDKITDKYQDIITELVEDWVEDSAFENKTQITQETVKIILMATFKTYSFNHNSITGIVITGFGKDEYYPVMVDYFVDGVIDNKLRIQKIEKNEVNNDTRAIIYPFAQTSVIMNFLRGIHPKLYEKVTNDLEEFIVSVPDILFQKIPNIDSLVDDKLKKEIIENLQLGLQEYFNGINKYQNEEFIMNFLDITAWLPKDELAEMAETLVRLQSFKQRMSAEIETVAGPIDVAIISKNDGFIWIKRKHYFDSDLNPNFFEKYFME